VYNKKRVKQLSIKAYYETAYSFDIGAIKNVTYRLNQKRYLSKTSKILRY